jgi:hypothetical protein
MANNPNAISTEIMNITELGLDFWRLEVLARCNDCNRIRILYMKVARNGAKRVIGCNSCKSQKIVTFTW